MPAKKMKMHSGKKGATFAVRVVPRARKNEISQVLDDGTVKIRLTAPPVDGKANAGLLTFLAEVLNVPAASISIVAGATGRNKVISVSDLDLETVNQRIESAHK